jgi:hypothetical protein
MTLPIYELKISENMGDDAEVDYIALVDAPAIQKDFLAFNFIEPSKGEHETDFIPRCISYVVSEGKDQEQAAAICYSIWEQHFSVMDIYGYKPTHFYMCPMATATFKHLVEMNVGIDEQGMIRSAAQIADSIFRIEKNVIDLQKATPDQVSEAVILLDDFYDLMQEIDKLIGMVHDVSYMEAHIEKIKSFADSYAMQFESYTDYPKAASENAKAALRYAEKNGWGSCGTPVGKIRANQLANGEPISRDTIARMAAFERHRQNSQKELGDGCGRLMWLAWGGDAGVEWATRKLAQIDKDKMSFKIMNEEKRIISGPMMLADELIYRNNEKIGEHYVKFSADTIKAIAIKFAKRKYNNRVNLMHDPNQKVKGVTMFESWLVDKERGIMPMKGFEGVADGSWFASFYVENNDVWNAVKRGEYKGFSVEGMFEYDQPMTAEENALKKIAELLSVKITN